VSAVGRYQPYALFVPAGPAPHGLELHLHGLSQTHAAQVEQPGMQQRFGEDLNRILVAPLGRGPYGWYSDSSERDVLDALADAQANYATDRERIVMSGYSMGGYGTYYFAALYPQLFAGFVGWVGYPGDGCLRTPAANTCPNGGPSNVYEFFENLEHIPGAMLYSGEDELVNYQQGEAVRERFSELALPHVFYFHPGGDHFTYLAADDWAKEAAFSAGRTRVQRPAHVRYRAEPWVDAPALGIRHDRAYWVHDIVGRGAAEDEYFDVELTAFGCGGTLDQTTVAFPAATGDDPVPWTSQEGSVTGQTALPVQNRLEGQLRNVVSAGVDGTIAGACIDPAAPLTYRLTTDGPVAITVSGYRQLALPGAGTHEGVLLPEPSPGLGLAAGAALLCALGRRVVLGGRRSS
jgi:dienelactone hydrolase